MRILALTFLSAAACSRGASHGAEPDQKTTEAAAAQSSDFEAKRVVRIDVLRAEHTLIASQPVLVSALATEIPLTESGRADVNEKLQILMMRIDETGNAITALQSVEPAMWPEREDEASRAMSRLEDARRAAFEALRKAPRTDSAPAVL